MADVLQFRDDDEKAVRRYCARVRHRIERIDELTRLARDPFVSRDNWIVVARKVIEDIAHEPAAVRTECNLLSRLLILKGLVDEAEVIGFAQVTAAEPAALDMVREVNDDLRARMGARRAPGAPLTIIESTPGSDGGWSRERFLRPASLTPDLISDNLRLPGRTSSPAVKTAGSAPPSSLAGSATFTAADLLPGFLRSLFHGVKVRRRWRKVREKARGVFSLRQARPHPDDLGGGGA